MFVFLSMVVVGCSDSYTSEPDVSEKSVFEQMFEYQVPPAIVINKDVVAMKGGKGKVSVCHFPGGNQDNPQLIEVSGNAATAHLSNHDGDGLVGDVYDEDAGVLYDSNCDPLPQITCPCWDVDDLRNDNSWFNARYGGNPPVAIRLYGSNTSTAWLTSSGYQNGTCASRNSGVVHNLGEEVANQCYADLEQLAFDLGFLP